MEKNDGGDFPPKNTQRETAEQQNQLLKPFPAKKLARQLDFTRYNGGITVSTPPMPQHPQLQPAVPKLIQPQALNPFQPTQVQLQPSLSLMPISEPSAPYTSIRHMELELSPRLGRRSNPAEAMDDTPKKPKQCNCKHSKCLKLYCECFAAGIYCDKCNCVNCHNNVEEEASRTKAVEAILERNPEAFRPKIVTSPLTVKEEISEGLIIGKHNKGCNCKKSGCLKKYCECFQANILCSDNCKCLDCKNSEGNKEKQSPPLSENRKSQELVFSAADKDHLHRLGQFQQAKYMMPSPNTRVPAEISPSKHTYRSLLADIIQPQDVKELCSQLVLSAQTLADETKSKDKDKFEQDENERNRLDEVKNPRESVKCDDDDVSEKRPRSPGTLSLMCNDEQDTMFNTTPPIETGNVNNINESYADQERIVLTKFRDCLTRLITLGDIKQRKLCSMTETDSGDQRDVIISNGDITGTNNQQEPLCNDNGNDKSTLAHVQD